MIEVDAKNALEVAQKVKAGELPGPAKSLAEAMARVMTAVGYVQKDKAVVIDGRQRYKYAGEAAVIASLRPELVRQQIVVTPVAMEPLAMDRAGNQNRVVLRVTFRFTHAPSNQCLDVVTIGEGMDVGDKAANKAMTGAMKYALRQAFVIETGDDPDDTPSQEQERAPAKVEPPKKTPAPAVAATDNLKLRAQYTQAYALCKDHGAYLATRKAVVADIEAGKLSQADIDALRQVDVETLKRCPAPKPQTATA